jgi:hypothetical protein
MNKNMTSTENEFYINMYVWNNLVIIKLIVKD